jgi:hypothetical protein
MILTEENRRTRIKTCSSATLSTTNSTWTVLGANLGLHDEKLVTNLLNYGMAVELGLITHIFSIQCGV